MSILLTTLHLLSILHNVQHYSKRPQKTNIISVFLNDFAQKAIVNQMYDIDYHLSTFQIILSFFLITHQIYKFSLLENVLFQ